MPVFGNHSKAQLATVDERLQQVLMKAIEFVDFTVLEGHRGRAAQDRAFAEGKSQVKWPNGNHNKFPSRAVDLAPYPIDWNNRERFVYLAGIILGVAHSMGIKLRWGGDWNRNHNLKDQNFFDLPHFELVD